MQPDIVEKYFLQFLKFKNLTAIAGVGASGTPVPIEILKIWVPLGTGYRENFHLCRPLLYNPNDLYNTRDIKSRRKMTAITPDGLVARANDFTVQSVPYNLWIIL